MDNNPKSRALQRIDFMGMRFHDVTMQEVIHCIDEWIQIGRPHRLFSTNVACLVYSRKDAFLRTFYDSCDLLTLDSMGIYYSGLLMGLPFRETVPASYLMFELLSIARKKHYRIFLLGSRPDIVKRAAINIAQRYPGVDLSGFHHGYFSSEEEGTVIELINRSRPDILFVGMTSPLKERFVHQNLGRLNVPAQIGVGGTIDAVAGEFRLPPPWLRRVGCEWLYHLCQEPHRLWKRYLLTNTIFAFLLIRQFIHKGLYRVARTLA